MRRRARGVVNVSCTGAVGGPISLPSQHRRRTGRSPPKPARTSGSTTSATLMRVSLSTPRRKSPPVHYDSRTDGCPYSFPAPYPAMVDSNGSLRADGPAGQRREIMRLAVPAFLALVAEPLFLLADSAIIGHLGTTQLAGLGGASAALITAANIFVFLAYGTTSIVARQVGAGSERLAVGAGIDGLWLAITIGIVTVSYTHLTLPPNREV